MNCKLFIGALTLVFLVRANCYCQDRILIPLVIRDNGGITDTLTFGFHPNATYCIDGQIDSDLVETELPFGMGGIFDCRFVEHRSFASCLGVGLSVHIQEFSKRDTFRLHLTPGPGGYPMHLSWPGGLGSVLESLILSVPGSLPDPPSMLSESTATITNTGIDVLDITGTVKLTGITGGDGLTPQRCAVSQNYPNPFNPSTRFTYTLPSGSPVSLEVFDILGREVASLVNENQQAGEHHFDWNADDLPGGVYFYRLVAGVYAETRKMVLLR